MQKLELACKVFCSYIKSSMLFCNGWPARLGRHLFYLVTCKSIKLKLNLDERCTFCISTLAMQVLHAWLPELTSLTWKEPDLSHNMQKLKLACELFCISTLAYLLATAWLGRHLIYLVKCKSIKFKLNLDERWTFCISFLAYLIAMVDQLDHPIYFSI